MIYKENEFKFFIEGLREFQSLISYTFILCLLDHIDLLSFW